MLCYAMLCHHFPFAYSSRFLLHARLSLISVTHMIHLLKIVLNYAILDSCYYATLESLHYSQTNFNCILIICC